MLAGIAVLLAISYWAWFSQEISRPPARGAKSSAHEAVREAIEHDPEFDPAAGEGGAESAAVARSAEAEEGEDGERVRAMRISGVVFEDRVPAAGARVTARRGEESDRPGHTGPAVITGADGRFSFELHSAHGVRVEATKGDRLRGAKLFFPEEFDEKEARIDLKRATLFTVKVIDRRDRSPIENARVSGALDHRTRVDFNEPDPRARWAEREFGPISTDREGRATLLLMHAGDYEIEAEHDALGVAVVERPVALEVDPPELVLELSGASAIFGRVVDEDGQPQAKIPLVLFPKDETRQFGYRRAVSDADGQFQIRGVETGKYRLRSQSNLYPDTAIDIEKKDDNNDLEVEVVLKNGLPVSGRVVDSLDAPVGGLSLFLSPTGGGVGRSGKSKSDGSFLFERVSPGSYVLLAVRAGKSELAEAFQSNSDRLTLKAGDRDVVLRVRRAAALKIELGVRGAPPPKSYEVLIDELKREQPGSKPEFLVDGLSPGMIDVLVRAKGFAPQAQDVGLTEGATVTVSFTLVAEKTLRGVVIDARSKAPLASATVQALPSDRASPERSSFGALEPATTEADGTFILRGLPEAMIRLSVRASAHAVTLFGPVDVREEQEPIVIAVPPGLKVSGRVHAGPLVPEWSTLVLQPTDDYSTISMVTTDKHGAFEFDTAAPGRQKLNIRAELNGGSKSKNLELDVPAAGLTGLDIDFQLGEGRLVVALPSGRTRGALLMLMRGSTGTNPEDAASHQSAVVQPEQQEQIFEGLPTGEYELQFHELGPNFSTVGAPAKIKVTIAEGEPETRVSVPAR